MEKDSKILITGASGFLGRFVVQRFIEEGYSNLRCFVRPSSRMEALEAVVKQRGAHVETVRGDLLSREDCARAAEGIEIVCHLAAGFDKSFAGAFMNSALTTRNLFEAFAERGKPRRFVNVSSFAVYSNLGMRRGAILDEECPLESEPQLRFDAYGFGKLEQEKIVRELGAAHRIPYVILRPGTVYGPGKTGLTGRIGIDTFGFMIHIGGSNQLPLTYVENCADAIVIAAGRDGVDGKAFNIVDDETLTSREFLNAWKQKTKRWFSFPLPYGLAWLLCSLWEDFSVRRKGQLPPAFNRRRCAAEWQGNRFVNKRAKEELGWRPRVGVDEGMARFLAQFDRKVSR